MLNIGLSEDRDFGEELLRKINIDICSTILVLKIKYVIVLTGILLKNMSKKFIIILLKMKMNKLV